MPQDPSHLHTTKGNHTIGSNGHDRIGQITQNQCLPSQAGIVFGHFFDEGLFASTGRTCRFAVGDAFGVAFFFFAAGIGEEEGGWLGDWLVGVAEELDVGFCGLMEVGSCLEGNGYVSGM